MNQMTTSAIHISPFKQPPSLKVGDAGVSFESRKSLPAYDLSRGRVTGARTLPPVNPGRRALSMGIAIAIQAAFVAGVLALGMKMPAKVDPMMVVNITTQELKPEELPPPPPTLVQPQVTITMPYMPEILQDVPPPPMPVNTTAITAAPKGSAPTAPVYTAEKYETVLLRSINAALRYPVSARQRHQQGTVYVRFVMDRRGHVLSSQVERTSRFPALDEEGLALLARAQPLPAPPADVVGEQIQLVVPIVFSLRN